MMEIEPTPTPALSFQKMMEMGHFPVGFRFNPTDKQLLMMLNEKKKAVAKSSPFNPIVEADVYNLCPWELPGVGTANKSGKWYYFTKREKKMRNACGFWKATSSAEKIIDPREKKVIGHKRKLTYCLINKEMMSGNAKWTMKEYSVPRRGEGEEELVVCKIKRDKISCRNKSKEMVEAPPASKNKEDDGRDEEKHEHPSVPLVAAMAELDITSPS